jgi:hypothetical protein
MGDSYVRDEWNAENRRLLKRVELFFPRLCREDETGTACSDGRPSRESVTGASPELLCGDGIDLSATASERKRLRSLTGSEHLGFIGQTPRSPGLPDEKHSKSDVDTMIPVDDYLAREDCESSTDDCHDGVQVIVRARRMVRTKRHESEESLDEAVRTETARGSRLNLKDLRMDCTVMGIREYPRRSTKAELLGAIREQIPKMPTALLVSACEAKGLAMPPKRGRGRRILRRDVVGVLLEYYYG